MGDDYTLDALRWSDIDRVTVLRQRTHEEHKARMPTIFNVEPGQTFQAELKHRFGYWPFRRATAEDAIACRQGSDLAGYLLYNHYYSDGYPGPVGWHYTVEDICVVPQHRGQGVARRLLSNLDFIVQKGGGGHIHAFVWDGNAMSAALFSSASYSPTGTYFGRTVGAADPSG